MKTPNRLYHLICAANRGASAGFNLLFKWFEESMGIIKAEGVGKEQL